MKCILAFITLLVGGMSVPAQCQSQSAAWSKVDSLHTRPRPSREGRSPGLATSQSAGQLLTLVVRPTGRQTSQDIFLPIDIDSASVRVRAGDSLLRLETDYVFLPTNRLRMVSQAALKADQAIRISFRRLRYSP